ncbi:hypothetical protein Nepgr_001186 [Nepenthes gracilis]|uniref:RNase H type-1 domain-containing protein n=1 Tax=Nepenthes gracilis TaxID=150966 RepID=A0AAD3P843_NEPGR|nr:hypothetical protein Nepgr_001186 [Nepenthes gracilis]
MGDERQAFYVVKKGDIVGIYKSFSDCQAQAGSSPWDPSILIYKGYCLPKEAEEFLVSFGLKNAGFSITASELQDGLFGSLAICPFQDAVKSSSFSLNPAKKHDDVGSSSVPVDCQNKHLKLENYVEPQALTNTASLSCIIEYDGASKGNPGQAGAGVVLRAEHGMVWRLREGIGIATNNVAEYRAVILGMKCALKGGFKHVLVRGDSQLVCMQIQGLWKTKNQNMVDLCREARELRDKFTSFRIEHITRELNFEADAQANFAISLHDGEVQVDVENGCQGV